MSSLFDSIVYRPLYNAFILLADTFPFFDAGIIVILFTIAVKFLLYPLAKKAFIAREDLKILTPKIQAVKEKYANDKERQAKELMAIYGTAKTNPFSSIFLVLIQLPVIFALYFILIRSGLPVVNTELLYSFIPIPEEMTMNFLGFIDVAGKNIFLALLAGVTAYMQIKFTSSINTPAQTNTKGDELAKMMQVQMKFMFPVLAFVVSYSISGVVALYWATSNIVTLLQEKHFAKKFSGK